MIDVNVTIKVPAVEKLVDYTASGIGAVAGPMLVTPRANAEAKALVIKAKGEAEALKIKAEGHVSSMSLITNAQAEAQRYYGTPAAQHQAEISISRNVTIEDASIRQRLEFQERKQQRNIAAVVQGAAEKLEGKTVPDHEPDPDWTARFFSNVQDVSSEHMQEIWIKILAGEVEMPERTSLRTLDTLKNMTQGDAKIFSKISKFIIGDSILLNEKLINDIKNKFPNYPDILHINSYGLLQSSSGIEYTFKKSRYFTSPDGKTEYCVMGKHGNFMIFLVKGTRDSVKINLHTLTNSGKDLHGFINNTGNMEYLRFVAAIFKEQGDTKLLRVPIDDYRSGTVPMDRVVQIDPLPPHKAPML